MDIVVRSLTWSCDGPVGPFLGKRQRGGKADDDERHGSDPVTVSWRLI